MSKGIMGSLGDLEKLLKEKLIKADGAHRQDLTSNIHAIRSAVTDRHRLTGLIRGDVLRQKKFGDLYHFNFDNKPIVFVRYLAPGEHSAWKTARNHLEEDIVITSQMDTETGDLTYFRTSSEYFEKLTEEEIGKLDFN